MKTLFLASYFAGVENLFRQFLKQHFLLHKVLFIPTAGNVESYVEYINEAKDIFHKLGFEVDVLDIAQETEEIIKEKLNYTPSLYVSGGNTFYLLQELKRKHLLPHIKNELMRVCFTLVNLPVLLLPPVTSSIIKLWMTKI